MLSDFKTNCVYIYIYSTYQKIHTKKVPKALPDESSQSSQYFLLAVERLVYHSDPTTALASRYFIFNALKHLGLIDPDI